MQNKTDYVQMHVVNYEPTYKDLMVAVEGVLSGLDLQQARDILLDSVHQHYEAMGLKYDDIDDSDVSYTTMIMEEAGLS
jgi:hypothetical protein